MASKGRPRIELKDLPDKWEESIINLAKKGGSIVEIAVEGFVVCINEEE